MTKVIKISLLFIMFILVFLFTSCTEQKQREYDIIDGNIYIDLFENKDEFLKDSLKEYNKNPYYTEVFATATVKIYVDYHKMDDYMKAIHRYNLKYSYSNEEDKIKDNYYFYLNSYTYQSFNYDFNEHYAYLHKNPDPNRRHPCNFRIDEAIVKLYYINSTDKDPTLSTIGLDNFYLDYDKIKEISTYDYVIKIEVIETCEIYYFE